MTKNAAKRKLNKLAEEATDENYHTEAEVLWAAVDVIDRLTERTIILVPGMGTFHKIEVTP